MEIVKKGHLKINVQKNTKYVEEVTLVQLQLDMGYVPNHVDVWSGHVQKEKIIVQFKTKYVKGDVNIVKTLMQSVLRTWSMTMTVTLNRPGTS